MANKKVFNPLGMPFDTVRDDIADLTTRNASDVVNTPAGDIVATNVQTAINELDTEKVPYTGGTGNVDIGDFELRAQTLESDVATGTAPFTIASTTVNTNLNADLLDGLHDTSFAKTTAGQTINVSTAAELIAALALLAAAPSLLGNVIIQVTADITGNFTVPTLIYNGFDLIIQGELEETLSDIASAGTDWGANPASVTKDGTNPAWVANAYRGQILKNPSGHYVVIAKNDTTVMKFSAQVASFTKFSNTEVIKVYKQKYTITGSVAATPAFILSEYAKATFKYVKVDAVTAAHSCVECRSFSKIINILSYFKSDTVWSSMHMLSLSSLLSYGSVYQNKQYCVRLETGATYTCRDEPPFWNINGDLALLSTSPSGGKTGILFQNGSSGNIWYCSIMSEDSKPAGSRGLYCNTAKVYHINQYTDGFETAMFAQYGGMVLDLGCVSTDYTTEKNPAAAAIPAYIL